MGATIFGLHAIGLVWAENDKQQAGFILVTVAMVWTLLASWQLQRALLADNALEIARIDAGVENDMDVAYSDDEATAGLLIDQVSGLRGRPDQIVIVEGEFIPVEQKLVKFQRNLTNLTKCNCWHISTSLSPQLIVNLLMGFSDMVQKIFTHNRLG